jgi:CheY-like chemotaxis protein
MPRILVVDDHVANCLPLVRLFKYAGMEARCAASGREALDALAAAAPAERLPDLVVLDLMMPEMDGFEVLRHVRQDDRYGGVAVVMYTAVADEHCRRRAFQHGAQGYVVKGTGFDDLRAEVERHVRGG